MKLIDKIKENSRNIVAQVLLASFLIYSGKSAIDSWHYEYETINSINSIYDSKTTFKGDL